MIGFKFIEHRPDEAKPCPFCGRTDALYSGEYGGRPDAYWDSAVRGEDSYGYVVCRSCGVILKDYDEEDAIRSWNHRAGEECSGDSCPIFYEDEEGT